MKEEEIICSIKLEELSELLEEYGINEINFVKSEQKDTINLCYEEDNKSGIAASIVKQKTKQGNHKVLNIYTEKEIEYLDKYSFFKDNIALKEVNFNGLVNFSNVKSLEQMFSGCEKLKKVDFGKSIFKKLESTNHMFVNCEQLEEIIGFDFNCPKLKYCTNMFYGCINLKDLDFSNANLEKLEITEGMFFKCQAIENFDMSNVELTNLENARSMFELCIHIQEIKIKKVPQLILGNYMFDSCLNLKVLDIEFNFENITGTIGMFRGCESLESFDFDKFNPKVLQLAQKMFEGCKNLKGEAIFNNIKYEGDTLESMFKECECIEKIDMTRIKAGNIKNVKDFACGCSKLKSIEMCGFTTDELEIYSFVKMCESLKYVSLENVKVRNGGNAIGFASDCKNLQVVKLGFSINNMELISDIFKNCNELRVLQYPFGENEKKIEHCTNAYLNCNSLKAISLEDMKINSKEFSENKMNKFFSKNLKLMYVKKKNLRLMKDQFHKNGNIVSSMEIR